MLGPKSIMIMIPKEKRNITIYYQLELQNSYVSEIGDKKNEKKKIVSRRINALRDPWKVERTPCVEFQARFPLRQSFLCCSNLKVVLMFLRMDSMIHLRIAIGDDMHMGKPWGSVSTNH